MGGRRPPDRAAVGSRPCLAPNSTTRLSRPHAWGRVAVAVIGG
ncbi:hypothetical protein [Actinoallomurus acanthiterrae]